jgi:hypothetical protein
MPTIVDVRSAMVAAGNARSSHAAAGSVCERSHVIHLADNPVDHMDYDQLGLSAWLQVGYEWALGERTYLNVRPTVGYLLRAQPWPNGADRGFINGFVDANLGVRF